MNAATQPGSAIPADDPNRKLVVSNPDGDEVPHISVAGDTYTVLVAGAETNGRYCLIDMHIPPNGGPPPHRHDFEENFTLLEGELEFTFRGEPQVVQAPASVNVPANAPHAFKNKSDKPARALCICAPAGQEEFFTAVGDAVDSRTAAPPQLSPEEQQERQRRAEQLAPKYKTEIFMPWLTREARNHSPSPERTQIA